MALPPHIVAAPPGPAAARQPVYALVGNPNCGKTTLFNALTGLKQKVANYPGVTIEKKVGTTYSQHGQPITVIDLPGTYSLAARSPDEAVTRDVLLGRRADTPMPDRILCIVDATNLERNLYLVHQILDLGRPVIVAVNMMDLAVKAGLNLRLSRLERELGVPVIPCEALHGKGLIDLRLAMSRPELPLSRHAWDVPTAISAAVSELQAALSSHDRKPPLIARAEALLLLTDQDSVRVAGSTPLHARTAEILAQWKNRWAGDGTDWAATLVNSRYAAIQKITADVVLRAGATGPNRSDKIDAVVTHPVWGWLILGSVLTLLFVSIFSFAETPMTWIDDAFSALADWTRGHMGDGDLRDLITDGAIAGVGGVVKFLPQILILFFFVGLLESTGYMARAAFMMDGLMGRVGLNGKSFIPMLSSFACAIPGVMATRTIEKPRDRLVTILVAPLMSCSARLPVYLLLISALLPSESVPVFTKAGIMVAMYVVGTVGAFFFAWLFKRTLLKGEPPPMMMELPPYQRPELKVVVTQMLDRAWSFIRSAGTVILGISILLWFLAAYPKAPEGATKQQQIEQSFAGRAGHLLEPVIKPLGFDWQIGIGLITSFYAREVFVTTMSVVFNAESEKDKEDTKPLRDAMLTAKWPDGRPLFTPLVCVTLMIFYVFAMQCVSTLAVVKQETGGWKWPIFQTLYMTATAWLASFIVYQGGRLLGF
ncbi:MAG: hypothetical protein RLZZ15_4588 [Verrucomicrobiota bacterium]|jgi:ferrous iron transport protein B